MQPILTSGLENRMPLCAVTELYAASMANCSLAFNTNCESIFPENTKSCYRLRHGAPVAYLVASFAFHACRESAGPGLTCAEVRRMLSVVARIANIGTFVARNLLLKLPQMYSLNLTLL